MSGGREVGRRFERGKLSMPYPAVNMPMVDATERGGLAIAALALIAAYRDSEVPKGTRP